MPAVSKISRVVRDRNSVDASFTKQLAIVAAGSAGSSRLSDVMRENSFNLISVEPDRVQIDIRKYNKALPASRYYLCSA